MALENARGHESLNISAAFSGLAALVVLLRLYTRCFVVRSLGVEDYFICLSLVRDASSTSGTFRLTMRTALCDWIYYYYWCS
jgi:hypothetical protein